MKNRNLNLQSSGLDKKTAKTLLWVVMVFFFLFMILGLASVARGEETGLLVGGEFNCDFLSDYLGSNGAIFYDGAVGQCALAFDFEQKWTLKLWHSRASRECQSFACETDVTLFRGLRHGEWDITIGTSFFDINDPDLLGLSDVWNPWAEFSKRKFYLVTEFYFPSSGSLPGNGVIIRGGLRREHQFKGGLVGNGGVELFADSGAFDSDSGLFGGLQGSLSREVVQGFALNLSAKATASLTPVDDGRTFHLTWGFGFSRSF